MPCTIKYSILIKSIFSNLIYLFLYFNFKSTLNLISLRIKTSTVNSKQTEFLRNLSIRINIVSMQNKTKKYHSFSRKSTGK